MIINVILQRNDWFKKTQKAAGSTTLINLLIFVNHRFSLPGAILLFTFCITPTLIHTLHTHLSRTFTLYVDNPVMQATLLINTNGQTHQYHKYILGQQSLTLSHTLIQQLQVHNTMI